MAPGDLIVFHGIVGGERGTCLVISVMPLYSSASGMMSMGRIKVMTKRCNVYEFITDLYAESVNPTWSLISEKRAA